MSDVTEDQYKSLQTDLRQQAKIVDEQQSEIERLSAEVGRAQAVIRAATEYKNQRLQGFDRGELELFDALDDYSAADIRHVTTGDVRRELCPEDFADEGQSDANPD